MDFILYYLVTGLVFTLSIVGYWVATLPLRDPAAIYAAPGGGH